MSKRFSRKSTVIMGNNMVIRNSTDESASKDLKDKLYMRQLEGTVAYLQEEVLRLKDENECLILNQPQNVSYLYKKIDH